MTVAFHFVNAGHCDRKSTCSRLAVACVAAPSFFHGARQLDHENPVPSYTYRGGGGGAAAAADDVDDDDDDDDDNVKIICLMLG